MQGSAGILQERRGRVGVVTLDRPPLNVLDIDAFEALHDVLADLTSRDPVDVVVLRAAGSMAFCAGADVKDHLPERAARMLESFHRVARLLWTLDAVSLGAAGGPALGGGFELLLCCDLVVASERAEFGQPEIKVGAFPPIASVVLPARAGRAIASDLVLTGRRMSAFEALALGLVSRVARDGDLDAEVDRVVAELTEGSGAVMRRALRALRASGAARFSDELAVAERIYLQDLLELEDAREGIEAFLQKRKPRWKGRGQEAG